MRARMGHSAPRTRKSQAQARRGGEDGTLCGCCYLLDNTGRHNVWTRAAHPAGQHRRLAQTSISTCLAGSTEVFRSGLGRHHPMGGLDGGGGASKYATSQILTRLDKSTRTSASEAFQMGVRIAIAYSFAGSIFLFRLGLVAQTAPTGSQGNCTTGYDAAAS